MKTDDAEAPIIPQLSMECESPPVTRFGELLAKLSDEETRPRRLQVKPFHLKLKPLCLTTGGRGLRGETFAFMRLCVYAFMLL